MNSILFALGAYALTLVISLGVAGVILLIGWGIRMGQRRAPQQGGQE